MKTKKKIALTALSAVLVGSLISGTVIAFAHEDTYDHAFDAKNDKVWEDFDKLDDELNQIITVADADKEKIDLGAKSYLHVEYASPLTDKESPIFKEGINTAELGSAALVIEMRSPDESVTLSDLFLALRHNDDDILTDIPFNQLLEGEDELSSEWHTYVIGFENNAYLDEHAFPSGAASTSGELLGLHIYSSSSAEGAGKLDINQIYYNLDDEDDNLVSGRSMINNFMNGDTVMDTANNAWWADSNGGTIVKRSVNMTGGEFDVVKEAVGKYKYAVIEAEGDIENLKVATTTDGTAWGTAVKYDGTTEHAGSVEVAEDVKGFKFTYEGSDSVTIKRIYLTNLVVKIPATAVPVIDASTAEFLEDFSVEQLNIDPNYDLGSKRDEAMLADCWYRISYDKNTMVSIKDGALVFDATELPEKEWISYSFERKTAVNGKYLVFKVKGEEGGNMAGVSFKLNGSREVAITDCKSGVDYPTAYEFNKTNPYNAGDGWYYVVIDIDESDLARDGGYSALDIYYRGEGKLYIDSIFVADQLSKSKLTNVEQDFDGSNAVDFAGNAAGYAYAGGFALNNYTGTATTISFDITPKADDFDPSTLRLGMGSGTYWAAENDEGTLITTDGEKLNELTYTKDEATHVEIDVAASGIGAFEYVHVHVNEIGGFKLDNAKIHLSTAPDALRDLDYANTIVNKSEEGEDPLVDFVPNAGDGYQWAGYVGFEKNYYGKLEFTLVPGEDFDIETFRFNGFGTDFYPAQHEEEDLTGNGVPFKDVTVEAGVPINFVIDLRSLGYQPASDGIHFHSNASKTGPFQITSVKVTPYKDYTSTYFAAQMEALETSLVENAAPIVTVTPNKTTATVGDEITFAYEASDNVSAKDKLTVVSVTVVDADDASVTATGNKFTASKAGTYTITVVVKDEAGNEGTGTVNVTVTAPSDPGTTDPTPSDPGTTDPTPSDPGTTTPAEEENKTDLTWLWVLLGIVGGCGVGVGVYFLVKKLRNKKN